MDETCTCTKRSTGFHQHPEFLERDESGAYVFEFLVCGVCNRPAKTYLDMKMEQV